MQPHRYSKAYYRKGQACSKLKRFADAVESFEKGSQLEPDNKLFKVCAGRGCVSVTLKYCVCVCVCVLCAESVVKDEGGHGEGCG